MKRLPSFNMLLVVFLLANPLAGQETLLQSGPMVSYSTMKEVKLWVQTTQPAEIIIKYWNLEAPEEVYSTKPVNSTEEFACGVHLLADHLEPGNMYQYELYINDQLVERPYPLKFQSQPIWLWRGDAPDFSFATGSCAFINEKAYDRPGDPYGGEYQIFESIHQASADFMLWLGDNVYLREADWNSETGIMHRFTHSRSIPELQPMLGNMHHYAIWDDHDFGPNNSDRSYHKKQFTEKVFRHFYPGLSYIFDNGITSYFQWADCEFFLMDNRYWRTPNKRSDILDPEILGKAQVDWLLDALVNSYAPFKFVVMGGQFLSTVEAHERYINIAPKERQYLLDKIAELKINGVIFITGDVHVSELSKLDLPNGYPIYDLTVSPLTSGVAGKGAEENTLQVPGTLVRDRNYAVLDVSGKRRDRALKISVYDSDGVHLWTREIYENDLKFPRNESR